MAVITAFSVKGAPGVTTTVMGLTMAWATACPGRSALAVDADPCGGDTAAGFLRGAVTPEAGVLALATARGVDSSSALDSATVHLRTNGTARVVVGVPDMARAGALPLAWDVVAAERDELHADGCDVVVDAGRLVADRDLPPWVADSDLALLTVRPSLPGVLAAHRFAATWPATGPQLEVVVLDARSPYRPAEVAEAIGLPLAAAVPFDDVLSRVYCEGVAPPRTFGRSEYARGLVRAAGAIGARANELMCADLVDPAEQGPLRRPAAQSAGPSEPGGR